jgi:hypothetical protein
LNKIGFQQPMICKFAEWRSRAPCGENVLVDVLVFVRRISGSSPCLTKITPNGENSYNTTKTALKRESQGRKLVAGAGFEPTTFRL